MTLIQKLPLGMALAACMMMSSCSQEDVQVAEPQDEHVNVSSNLKVAAVPFIPTTAGWAGDHVLAPGWEKVIESLPDDKQLYSVGTSTIAALYGNAWQPWIKPLPSPSQVAGNNAGNFATFMAHRKVLVNGSGESSKVKTKILNLQPGKKYMVTFKFASTIKMKNGKPTQYAPGVYVAIAGTIGGYTASTTLVDLTGKEAEWVSKTIIFEAQDTQADVIIAPQMLKNGVVFQDTYLCYMHVFVPQNAIIEQVP